MSNSVHTKRQKRYWQVSLTLIGTCLLVWLSVTLFPLILAQLQVTGTLFGWPMVFALAAFGVPLVYLAIIGVYSLVMDRIESSPPAPSDEEPKS